MCYILIPVKKLSEAKSRLSPVLDKNSRQKLSLSMLLDVLSVATRVVDPENVIVVSSDIQISEFLKKMNVSFFHEKGHGLNNAIEEATRALGSSTEAVLVLPSDIPFMKLTDLLEILNLGDNDCGRRVVISPSKNGGTNALLRQPPDVIPSIFGKLSFIKHVRTARTLKVPVFIYDSRTISFDIDTIEDLIVAMKNVDLLGYHTRRFIKSLKNRIDLDRVKLGEGSSSSFGLIPSGDDTFRSSII